MLKELKNTKIKKIKKRQTKTKRGKPFVSRTSGIIAQKGGSNDDVVHKHLHLHDRIHTHPQGNLPPPPPLFSTYHNHRHQPNQIHFHPE